MTRLDESSRWSECGTRSSVRATFEPAWQLPRDQLLLAAVHGARPGEGTLPPFDHEAASSVARTLIEALTPWSPDKIEPAWRGDVWEVRVSEEDEPGTLHEVLVHADGAQLGGSRTDGTRTIGVRDLDGDGRPDTLKVQPCSMSLSLAHTELEVPLPCCP